MEARSPVFTQRATRLGRGHARAEWCSRLRSPTKGPTTRVVVTDMEQARTKVLYQQLSCARGHMENDI